MVGLVQQPLPRLKPRAPGRDNRRRLVVVGNGMAGTRAVEEVLALGGGRQFSITMFGDEPYGNYNRPMLRHVLAGNDESAIFLHDFSWYRNNGITLHAGVRAERIDKNIRRVFSDDGRVTPYDILIIATGSRSHVPPLDGLHTPGGPVKQGIYGFRTLDDTRRMVAHARRGESRRAVVLGGGPLGLQAAQGLRSRGLDVHVVHSASEVTGVQGRDNVTGVRRRDGSAIPCGMVVLAAGMRPNVELAVLGGLPVERAIVVDDGLRVQDEEDIYAVGECVQHRGQVYGLVAPLWEQAAVLAARVTGMDRKAAYLGSGSGRS